MLQSCGRFKFLFRSACVLWLGGCASSGGTPAPVVARIEGFADTIYVDGTFITLSDTVVEAQALAVKNGKILALGSRESVMQYRGDNSKIVELNGDTVLPGFIDAHGHIADYLRYWGRPDVSSPPFGKVKTVEDAINILKADIASKHPAPSDLVFGIGYDDTQVQELRFPSREELDGVSLEHPVCVLHTSGDVATCNSQALQKSGFIKGAPDPKFGVIERDRRTHEATGLLKGAAVRVVLALSKHDSALEAARKFHDVSAYMASLGITTAVQTEADSETLDMLRRFASEAKLNIDVVAYLNVDAIKAMPANETFSKAYSDRLRIAGASLRVDGLLENRDAFLTKPYAYPPKGGARAYRGVMNFSQKDLNRTIAAYFERGAQTAIHCHGDACVDEVLTAIEKAPGDNKERRTVLVHGQVLRKDQVARLKEAHVFPAFVPLDVFAYGEWHRDQTLGLERIGQLDPLASTEKIEIRFSIHNGAPVLFPNVLYTLWAAVNRETRHGQILNPNESVSASLALRALIRRNAYQLYEEDTKGTLEPGKLADLVRLSDNPLKVAATKIKDIQVIETIKEGKTIWRRRMVRADN